MGAFKEAVSAVLMSDEKGIPPKYRDHALGGDLQGRRELHVGGYSSDWLILYSIDGDIVEFARTGTHDDLFRR